MVHRNPLDCVFKVENNSNEPRNIRGIFAKAGEIPHLYPYDTGVPGQFHYFIQFQHRENAEHALRLQLGSSAGLRTYPILSSPHLIEQFRSCNTSSSRGNERRDSASRRVVSPMVNGQPVVPGRSETGSLEGQRPDSGAFNLTRLGASTPPAYRTGLKRAAPSFASGSPRICVTTTNVDIKSTMDTLHTSFSLNPHLLMKIDGQPFTFVLKADSEQDPRTIIELLKLSSSERGNWMIAGAHFRRTGRPQGAIEIMYAMLEVLGKSGLAEEKLKPAFLLLSGCELDLAIRAKISGDGEASKNHYKRVEMWLQKVYGTSPRGAQINTTGSYLSPAEYLDNGSEAQKQDSENTGACKRKVRETSLEIRSVRRRCSSRDRCSGNKENRRHP